MRLAISPTTYGHRTSSATSSRTTVNGSLGGVAILSDGASGITNDEFRRIRELIYSEAGISLSDSKRALVCARLAKRLRRLSLRSHSDYLDYLETRDDGSERQAMINCLTTNKTDFFRESHHFDYLSEVVFPQLVHRAERGGPRRLNIWSAGCSIGHEPYSIAITILEHFASRRGWELRILASDINTEVLKTAAQGVYPLEHIDGLDDSIRRKYFLRGTGRWGGSCQVRPEVRRLVTFRQINFMDASWPFRSRFDVIFCRNVIIYFDVPTQQRLTLRFGEHLTDGGYLMLGHSEHPHWLEGPFQSMGQTIYRRKSVSRTDAEESWRPQPAIPDRSEPAARPKPEWVTRVERRDGRRESRPMATARFAKPQGVPSIARPAPHTVDRHNIVAGEYFATVDPREITTILGSCVAACLYDPQSRIGGMNHFLLPYQVSDPTVSARYGVHAMELLINQIMKLGGDRRRLRAKVFGGCNVLRFSRSPWNVGQLNCKFIHEFLRTERIPIVAERCGGNAPLRVHFRTDTAQAFVKAFGNPERLLNEEESFSRKAASEIARPSNDNITLF